MKIPLLSRWIGRRSSLDTPERWVVEWFRGGTEAASGIRVDEETALTYSAVFAAVRILSESVASLPLIVYRRLDRGKERATDHPLYRILHAAPNRRMTSYTLREVMMTHLLLWGNAYAQIIRGSDGAVRALWPLRPDAVTPLEPRGRMGPIVYEVQLPDQQRIVLRDDQVLHIPGLSFDGVRGYSPIRMAREAVGLGLAAEAFGGRFFANDARPGIVLKHPQALSDKARENLRKSWESMHQGVHRSHRPAILEEGMDVATVGIPPEDAQFLETRKFQVNEIARIYRIPPHMLADLDRATFSNIEHQSLEFVIHSLRPWLVRWEQSILQRLFLTAEQEALFAEFLVDGLLRGDTESRYRAYAVGRQWGWLSANDVRELENQNPVPGGDVYLQPLNMVEAGSPPPQQDGDGQRALHPREIRQADEGEMVRARAAAERRRRVGRNIQPVLSDAAARLVRRERNDILRIARRTLGRGNVQEFLDELRAFYDQFPPVVQREFRPAMEAMAGEIRSLASEEIGFAADDAPDLVAFVDDYLGALSSRWIGSSIGQLRSLALNARDAGEDPMPAVEQRLAEWEERRPGKVASAESVQAPSAFAKAVWAGLGVARLVWVTLGDSCPYCRELNGRVIAMQGTFIPAGTDWQPEGAPRPIRVDVGVGHPPAHEGCDCGIAASL